MQLQTKKRNLLTLKLMNHDMSMNIYIPFKKPIFKQLYEPSIDYVELRLYVHV